MASSRRFLFVTRRWLLIVALMAMAAPPLTPLLARAAERDADQAPLALSAAQEAELIRIEAYLEHFKTLEARFIQVTAEGGYSEGKMLVSRPGRLRFEYDPPNPALLIASGTLFLYYDRELEQATFLPLWETPLWFLLREKLNLRQEALVLGLERGSGILRLTLAQRERAEEGRVELEFTEQPLELRRWTLFDARGGATRVALINPDFGAEIDAKAFDTSGLKGASIFQREKNER